MAKVKTIQEKRKEMELALKRLEAFEIAIDKLEDHIKWDFGSIKHDENGNAVEDESGDDDWNYESYVAFKSVVDEIKALV